MFGLILPLFLLLASTAALFTPKDQLDMKLIGLIQKEEKSIQIAVYTFTHREIADALITAKERGVKVEVIVDPNSLKRKFPLAKLVKAKIPVYVYDPETDEEREHAPLMHHKVALFGEKGVWTGSFNFTYDAAKSNQENVLLVEDAELVAKYAAELTALKVKSCRPYYEYIAMHPKKKLKKGEIHETPLAQSP